jgi:hypothetical protein
MLASSRRSRSECRVSRPRESCRRQSNIAQAKGSTDAAVVSLPANVPVGVDAGGTPQSPTASPQPRARRCAATIHVPLHVVCHADGHPLHPRLGAISWSPSTVTRSRARGFGLGPSAGCFESAESKRLDRNFWSDRALRLAVSPELEILEQLARIQPARRPDHLRCTETGTRAAPE